MDKGPVTQRDTDSIKNIISECIFMIINVVKILTVSIYRFFIPPARKSVKDEIVVVTGSGHGIGRQLSKQFASLGAVVILWDINEEENEETAKQIRQEGGACHTYTIDVSDRNAVYSLGSKVIQDIGEVSILVNNAGVVIGRRLLDCPDDLIEKTFNVNLLAHFWTVKCFLPSMLRRNHGHIVNMSSSAGLIGLKNLADYSASKFGVVGFTEVLNYELVFSGYTGVHTTLVCPSFVKTGLFKGCKMRFPSVLAPLEIPSCVDRIMQGILTNQTMVCTPRQLYIFCVLKTILPVEALTTAFKFFGAADFMDSFIGQPDMDSVTERTDTAAMKTDMTNKPELNKRNGYGIHTGDNKAV